jgi:hypothetical protein
MIKADMSHQALYSPEVQESHTHLPPSSAHASRPPDGEGAPEPSHKSLFFNKSALQKRSVRKGPRTAALQCWDPTSSPSLHALPRLRAAHACPSEPSLFGGISSGHHTQESTIKKLT